MVDHPAVDPNDPRLPVNTLARLHIRATWARMRPVLLTTTIVILLVVGQPATRAPRKLTTVGRPATPGGAFPAMQASASPSGPHRGNGLAALAPRWAIGPRAGRDQPIQVDHGLAGATAVRGRTGTRAGADATDRVPDRLPAAVDLSPYSPPVALQGGDNSCVSWVVGYYMRGWYARRDGHDPPGNARGFAPMYLYSQLSHGRDVTTSFEDNLTLLRAEGVDTRAHYAQGDDNYTDGPTAAERANAARFAIVGYSVLFQGDHQGVKARWAIERAMATGNPVGLGIPVYDNFWNADAAHYGVDGARGKLYGNHAVFAAKYDRYGVWIENQWGASWGLKGWVRLSWSFIEHHAWEAVTMRVARG